MFDLVLIVVCLFIGWNLPEPSWAKKTYAAIGKFIKSHVKL